MRLDTGLLILLGFLSIVMGAVLEFKGISLLSPFIETPTGYLIATITCFITAMVIKEFDSK